MANESQTVAISAQNTFTDWLELDGGHDFTVRVDATALSANIRVQFAEPGETTAVNAIDPSTGVAYAITAAGVVFGSAPGKCRMRAGVPTGDFTSATGLNVTVRRHRRRPSA